MRKLLILLCIITLCVIGCDKIKPNIHPDKKGEEIGWYFGFKFSTKW